MSRKVITPDPGLTPGVAYYFSGMEEVRGQLRNIIQDLSVEQLGKLAFSGAHSIGALTLHIGDAEWWWMRCVVADQRPNPEDEHSPFDEILDRPDEFAKRGYTSEFCLQQIDDIRKQTREILLGFADKDLEQIFSFERRGRVHEYSLRWILHHLIDHEAQHKGQILMLKRVMNSK